jgi:DNA-binding GntR family transcriptional regulator
MGAMSNCPNAWGLSEISVARERPKCAETSGNPARMAEVNGVICDRIVKAVPEHGLPPGTKLVEDRLADLFDTSRAQVRDVRARPADEGVVTAIPNRGAFIASPTADEMREVIEARRLIEPALVRRLIAQRDTDAVDRLRALVEDEERARALQDRPTMERLSGEFHIRLAEYAGNRMLARSRRRLATIACLSIFPYDAPHATTCREDGHDMLLNAIVGRRADRADELMLEHLNHVESSLDLKTPLDKAVYLAAALMSR